MRVNFLTGKSRVLETNIESLVTLSVVSFLVLSLSGTVQQIFQKTQETIFFMSFEQLYTDSQQLMTY